MSTERLYGKYFSKASLHEIFQEKISDSKSVGRDGVSAAQLSGRIDSEIDLIIRKTEQNKYRFTKYKLLLLSKGAGKLPRELSIPSTRDKITLRALCNYLSEVFSECKIRKPHEFIKRIREVLASSPDDSVFLRIDVKDFYPSIDRVILLDMLKSKIKDDRILSLIASAVSTPTSIDKKCGIPQGLSISNILSAIYLNDIDGKWGGAICFGDSKTLWNGTDKYFRYVDDILIICESIEQAKKIYEGLSNDLSNTKKLECHPLEYHSIEDKKKTCIHNVDSGIDYLGFSIKKKNGKVNISIRKSSYQNIFKKLLAVMSGLKDKRNENRLIWRLNLKITGCRFDNVNYGWLHFFAQTENTSQLKFLDIFIQKQLSRLGKNEIGSKIKKFVKSYHEIRHNSVNTRYIPNFDLRPDRESMIKLLSVVTDKDESYYKKLSDEEIKEEYRSALKSEIVKLEKDVLEIFS